LVDLRGPTHLDAFALKDVYELLQLPLRCGDLLRWEGLASVLAEDFALVIGQWRLQSNVPRREARAVHYADDYLLKGVPFVVRADGGKVVGSRSRGRDYFADRLRRMGDR
jgi:hypothetical protein